MFTPRVPSTYFAKWKVGERSSTGVRGNFFLKKRLENSILEPKTSQVLLYTYPATVEEDRPKTLLPLTTAGYC
jgi:hypothetical protein